MIEDSFVLKDRFSLPKERKIQLGWFGIAPGHFPDEDIGGTKEAYGTLCKIESDDGKIIYRIVRSAAENHIGYDDNRHSDEEIVLVDYMGRLDLGKPSDGNKIELTIQPASPFESVCFLFDHPDPAYRAARLATIVAIALGIIGVVLAALPPSWYPIPAIVATLLVLLGLGLLLRLCR
jgi:hypothetical protein